MRDGIDGDVFASREKQWQHMHLRCLRRSVSLCCWKLDMFAAPPASIMMAFPAMPIWTESECETFFADGRASTTEPCQVRIADGRIVVDAGGAKGGWIYEGEEVGPEHFRLISRSLGGTASLHRFEGDDVLDGGWREGAAYGMWRITLSGSENG